MTVRLSLEGLEACAADFDDAVELQSDIDRFCSRSEWILPFHRAFLPDRDLFVYRGGDDGTSFAALAAREDASVGRYLEPLENMWCFACPLIGEDAALLLQTAARDLSQELSPGLSPQEQPGHQGAPLLLSGIPASRDPQSLLARIVRSLDASHELRAVDATQRFVASLAGGLDGFLSRRARSFRKNMRRAERRLHGEGLVFQHVDVGSTEAARDIYPRILAIEAKSWKSAQGNGADEGSMALFYQDMLPRVASRGGLRLLIVTREGSAGEAEDVAYLHGALTGDHFRGLQMSFDHQLAHLSLGNLMQLEMLTALCEEGAQSYDLGTRSDYKRRWAEEGLRTLTILARPR